MFGEKEMFLMLQGDCSMVDLDGQGRGLLIAQHVDAAWFRLESVAVIVNVKIIPDKIVVEISFKLPGKFDFRF